METILLPHSFMVNTSGEDIGCFSDDSEWLQKLDNFIYEEKSLNEIEKNVDSKNFESCKKNIDINANELNVIGETPLHLAVMFDDLISIRYLIEIKKMNVNQRCVGKIFKGGFEEQTRKSLVKRSDYDRMAYYGEYPLALAACFVNKEIYDYLIDKGADPNLQG